MGDGAEAAMFKGLAEDGAQAGGDMVKAAARLIRQTADIEDGNVTRTLTTDEEGAQSFTSLMADDPPPGVTSPSGGIGTGPPPDTETVIRVQSGTKGSWNKLLNTPEPNATYLVDDQFKYETDNLGRVTSSSASLNELAQSPSRNNYQQRIAGGAERLLSDHGGHIFGAQFGGPGEAINLTAMNKVVNTGTYKQLESTWVKAIERGDKVDTQVTIDYTGDGQRPAMYTIKSTINGITKTYYFDN